MRTLLAFIWRYHFFLLFLILELVAAVLIVRNNHHHASRFFRFSEESSSTIHQMMFNVGSFFSLRQENDMLAAENARFRSLNSSSFIITENGVREKDDTLYRQMFSFHNAEVISNSISRRNNYFIINKGSDQGIKPDMGVITENGLVGIIRAVSPSFSSAVSVLHGKTRISAELKNFGYKGYISWNGLNYRRGTLSDIPSHAPISIGDTVISSLDSRIFPSGIMIGIIKDMEINSATNFYELDVEFSCDFNRLNHVMIVENLMKAELDSLIQITQPEVE